MVFIPDRIKFTMICLQASDRPYIPALVMSYDEAKLEDLTRDWENSGHFGRQSSQHEMLEQSFEDMVSEHFESTAFSNRDLARPSLPTSQVAGG